MLAIVGVRFFVMSSHMPVPLRLTRQKEECHCFSLHGFSLFTSSGL